MLKIRSSLLLIGILLGGQLSAVSAHDKCDSLAIAATAAGIYWPPSAAFQVGYYLAKQIDESTSSSQNAVGGLLDLQCISAGNFGKISREQYNEIVTPTSEDANHNFKFLWDGAGVLAQKSLALNQAVSHWQRAREELRKAKLDGFNSAKEIDRLQGLVDAAHKSGMIAFDAYQNEHISYAETLQVASEMMSPGVVPSTLPPLSVDDVNQTAQNLLFNSIIPVTQSTGRINSPFNFEFQWFETVGCISSEQVSPSGVLASANRFSNDRVPPGTFLDESILVSPASIYAEASATFGEEVLENLPKLLPIGFIENASLPISTDDCSAVYSNSGALHIPCVNLQSSLDIGDKTTYKADLHLDFDDLPEYRFELLTVTPR